MKSSDNVHEIELGELCRIQLQYLPSALQISDLLIELAAHRVTADSLARLPSLARFFATFPSTLPAFRFHAVPLCSTFHSSLFTLHALGCLFFGTFPGPALLTTSTLPVTARGCPFTATVPVVAGNPRSEAVGTPSSSLHWCSARSHCLLTTKTTSPA